LILSADLCSTSSHNSFSEPRYTPRILVLISIWISTSMWGSYVLCGNVSWW